MKLSHSLAALMLALVAGSTFAATNPSATASAKPAVTKAAHKAKAATLHCKEDEAVVKGKCEKKPK
jgi:hypothetical protein